MPKLSIIIVNFNGRSFLRQCLASLHDVDRKRGFETIVVDNNSSDGSVGMVRELFPNVRLLENERNLGFARANNQGIAEASGDHVLMLNSDTRILDSALEKMIDFLDGRPDVAVVAPRLVYPDLSDQGGARSFPTPINVVFGRKTILSRIFPNNRYSKRYVLSRAHPSNEPFEADWVSGACLMARRETIRDIGLLDENYFMYWEDVDLCFRVKKAGWKIYCVPEAVVVHHEGKSTSRKVSNRCIIEFNKGAYRYYRKHHLESSYTITNVALMAGLLLRASLLLVVNWLKANPGKSAGDCEDLGDTCSDAVE